MRASASGRNEAGSHRRVAPLGRVVVEPWQERLERSDIGRSYGKIGKPLKAGRRNPCALQERWGDASLSHPEEDFSKVEHTEGIHRTRSRPHAGGASRGA